MPYKQEVARFSRAPRIPAARLRGCARGRALGWFLGRDFCPRVVGGEARSVGSIVARVQAQRERRMRVYGRFGRRVALGAIGGMVALTVALTAGTGVGVAADYQDANNNV